MPKKYSGGWPDGLDTVQLPTSNTAKARKNRHKRSPPYNASRAERVNAQAVELILERMRHFGKDWRVGCAIKIPKNFDENKAIKHEIAWANAKHAAGLSGT